MPSKIYFAGELFSLKHLTGNAILAESIHTQSKGRYAPILPQMLEQRGTSEEAVRNQDLKALISSDVGIFHFDGDEIDSGTVVEYMVAKFIDLPAVIIRTDFRARSDSKSAPWNLMLSFYPRTEVLNFDGMELFQKEIKQYPNEDYAKMLSEGVNAANAALLDLAEKVVQALDSVAAKPSLLNEERKRAVLDWTLQMPGESFRKSWEENELQRLFNDS